MAFVPLLLFLVSSPPPAHAAGDAPEPGQVLARQSRALVEQDLAIALEVLGRHEEAAAHYRAAIGLDPWLKAPWLGLASHALEGGSPEEAAHFAGVAVAIAPQDETAGRLLEQAQAGLPSTDQSRRAAARECGDRPEPRGADPQVRARWRACQERRAGLLASAGAPAAEPLTELARLDLEEDHPESAALFLTIAKTLGGGDAGLLAKALALSGNPCAAAQTGGAEAAWEEACTGLRTRRVLAERELHADLGSLDASERLVAVSRLEALIGAGLDAQAAVRRWRIDARRGPRDQLDAGGLLARPGQDWYPSHDPDGAPGIVWRRKPGDAALVAFAVKANGGGAEAALARLLSPRRPAALVWTPVTIASTDPVRARTSSLSLDADAGGRAEGSLYLIESPASSGVALVIAAFPGTGGLGKEGLEQTRAEIQEALAEAVLVPPRWATLAVLDAGDGEDIPVPITGGRTAPGDESASPWRTYPAGEFTLALPPGAIAATAEGAPESSAPQRAGSVLWFRGRFRDRDGGDVAIGDEARAGSVELWTARSEEEARTRALGKGTVSDPPLADPGAVLISTLDVTRALGGETGASAVSISRFRPSWPGVEWLVCRLSFGARLVEIDIPAVTGAASIALYWIPATVRPVHGTPPPPPVDLSGRLGILFLRPPPSERREAFYKEGDLRSREFTMMVARDYTVVLDTVSPDAFPVRLSHQGGGALVRLEKLPADSAKAALGGSEPLRNELETAVRSWLGREGFELTGRLVPVEGFKVSRSGAAAGLDATFRAVPVRAAAGVGETRVVSAKEGALVEARPAEASGRALLLCDREGVAIVLLALSWEPDEERRSEEIDLMAGSLRMLRRKAK